MLDQWILNEIEQCFKNGTRMVLLDPSQWVAFFIPEIEKRGYTVIPTSPALAKHWEMVREELFLRHDVSCRHADKKVIFYVTRTMTQLSFLFDYCHTQGCLDFSNPTEWVQKKIKKYFPNHPPLEQDLISIAAKESIGKTDQWWKDVLHNPKKLFQYEEELKTFLQNPRSYADSIDSEKLEKIEHKIYELLEQPKQDKPPDTLARELMDKIFDGLVKNQINDELMALYQKLSDSSTFQTVMKEYEDKFQIPLGVDPWQAHPQHCFEVLDLRCLEDLLSSQENEKQYQEKIKHIEARIKCNSSAPMIASWWNEVLTLLHFSDKHLSECTTLNDITEWYIKHFCSIDIAIRKLFACLPHEEQGSMKTLYNLYEKHLQALLHSWFDKIKEYQPNQQGFLVDLLENEEPGIAVIIADGLRYELALDLAHKLEKTCTTTYDHMIADMPSETEHNMSQLYSKSGNLIPEKKNRERALKNEITKKVSFKPLKDAGKSQNADYLVLSCGDIDTLGESLSIEATSLFYNILSKIQDTIRLLLNNGYRKVYLVTDHGFVLNAFLEISDKIAYNLQGKHEISERYIRTEKKQDFSDLIEFERKKDDFNFVYTAKNHRPFLSRGVYGYAHGGLTPQEVILPKFCFSALGSNQPQLEVKFKESKAIEVTGQHFKIGIKASEKNALFALNRKVYVVFYADHQELHKSETYEIETNELINISHSFKNKNELKAILYDATTREKLDELIIKQTQARDMGGLI